jgi:DNA-binding response OmpR family regulator
MLTDASMRQILIVDDESLICNVVADTFHDMPDHEVSIALDGDEGARKLRQTHYDLVVLDALLPKISGMALADIAAAKDIPVLMISGHPDMNEKLEKFGFPYLPKPFSIAQLMTEAGYVISHSEENIRRVKASAARLKAGRTGKEGLLF